ncbi:aspartate aminotransferase family protein [Geosporobacter ferrireducens]|uniref:aspartate aminotransferase family protein n=1 Tax=Geosporobacter ferrireducens TaxID=1424294 RepID=UPI00139BEC9A|nr:aspartate aminotransferase family protein [Geosporobacter ferrireducens]MTI57666.1 aspartate aminotransferase family protein [Geosporobacter ferrireducens]
MALDTGQLCREIATLDEALTVCKEEVKENYKSYINPYFAMMLGLLGFDKSFVKAEGMEVWDSEGRVYLDFLGGYGALNLGHNPREILEAVKKVMTRPNILQTALNPMASVLAKNLAAMTPGDLQMTFFCNSGAEAVEGAIKLAKAATGKNRILYCEGSFHGKTVGALSVTGREKYKTPFGLLMNEVEGVPFGDAAALETALREHPAAALILEPIQGEGGIIVPPEGYLKQVRALCNQYDALLIIDEVQTGFGRTGRMFACEYEEIIPDLLCLAKSLGGGVMPIGATMAKEEVWKMAYGSMDKCLLHTSTFGGNTLAVAAGIAATEKIYRENLADQAEEKGEYFISRLRELQQRYSIIREVRGKGLMIGIEFLAGKGLMRKVSEEYLGALVAGELLNRYGMITAYTLNNPNVIRLEPPLIIQYEEIDRMIDALEEICKKHKNFLSLAMSGSKTILHSIINR